MRMVMGLLLLFVAEYFVAKKTIEPRRLQAPHTPWIIGMGCFDRAHGDLSLMIQQLEHC